MGDGRGANEENARNENRSRSRSGRNGGEHGDQVRTGSASRSRCSPQKVPSPSTYRRSKGAGNGGTEFVRCGALLPSQHSVARSLPAAAIAGLDGGYGKGRGEGLTSGGFCVSPKKDRRRSAGSRNSEENPARVWPGSHPEARGECDRATKGWPGRELDPTPRARCERRTSQHSGRCAGRRSRARDPAGFTGPSRDEGRSLVTPIVGGFAARKAGSSGHCDFHRGDRPTQDSGVFEHFGDGVTRQTAARNGTGVGGDRLGERANGTP